MMEHQLDIDENEHAIMILRRLDRLRRDQKNCDLVISAERKKIHVNRDVMCAGSDYFNAMFSHDMKERQEGAVEMKDVEFSAVEKCIDFIYSGKISVLEEECEGLLYCASLMQLNQVCDKISPFLEHHLTSKSFFTTRRIASRFSLDTLNAACDEFALINFFRLAKEEEFSNTDIDFVSFLLSSKKCQSKRIEDSKLSISLQWIKADANNREKYLMNLVKLLDTTKLTAGYTRYLVESEPLCIKFPEFMRELFIGNANSNCVELTGPPDLSEISSTNEANSPNSLLIFDHPSKLVQCYYPSKNKLTRMNAYHTQVNGNFTACVLEEYLYVFNQNKKVFRLSISDKSSTWTQLTDMLHDHGRTMQCAAHEKFIYVGGRYKMERFNIGENEKWEDVDLHGNICHLSALVGYDGCVFVIGGYNSGSLNTVRKFFHLSSKWTSVKSMNIARQAASATLFDGKIYVAGGWDKQNLCDFEMYDSVSDLWTVLPKMNSPRAFFSLCLVDNQIFAVGCGFDNCSIEVYDSQNLRWMPLHDGPKMGIDAEATVAAFIPLE